MKPNLLVNKTVNSSNRFLVFTSAGDNSNLMLWLQQDKKFDIFICYYGDNKGTFSDVADFYLERKGGKFPNIHFCFTHFPEIFERYDAIFVADDDLILSSNKITSLFELREKYSLWLLQPAFNRRGKVSFKLTQEQPMLTLRYCNFIEVTCPLFKTEKLIEFLKVYDPILVGWGADIWFSNLLATEDVNNNKIAIIDAVSCINPRDAKKSNQLREIDKLQSSDVRRQVWEATSLKYNLPLNYKKIEFGNVKASPSFFNLISMIRIRLFNLFYLCYKKLSRDNWMPR